MDRNDLGCKNVKGYHAAIAIQFPYSYLVEKELRFGVVGQDEQWRSRGYSD